MSCRQTTVNLIRKLTAINPRWRDEVAEDPIEAAIELGLIENTEGDPEELDFNTVTWFGEYDE